MPSRLILRFQMLRKSILDGDILAEFGRLLTSTQN